MLQRLNWHSLEYRRKMLYLSWSLFLCKISNVKIVTTKKDALKQSLRRSQYMHFSSLSLRVRLSKDNNGFKLVRYLSGTGCYSLYRHEYRGRCFIISLFSMVMCNRWQNMQSVEGGQYLVEVDEKVEVPVSKPQSGLITESVKGKLIL